MLRVIYIVSYAGVKEAMPAYLDPTLSMEELLTGVSFASAGTGYDPLTVELSVCIYFHGIFYLLCNLEVINVSI